MDSPGVIFDDADTQVDGAGKARATSVGVLLRNVVKVEDINDVVGVGKTLAFELYVRC